MLAVRLVVAVQLLAQSAAPPDPADLVDRLGSARYAEREATARALEQLGRQAIPALQLGRESRDLEVRTRAEAILRRVEGMVLTQPTMVRLDFSDVPLPEVVAELGRRSGMKLALFPENLPVWKTQRVTLREPEALPFWKAIDRLCQAAALQSDLELHGISPRNEPTLTLSDRNPRPLLPSSDHGPFRVSVVGLDYQRHVGFAIVPPRSPRDRAGLSRGGPADPSPPLPRAVTSVQFTLQMQVVAEPRLGLNQTGPLQILEAVDDRGNSLVAAGQAAAGAARANGYLGGTCTPVLHLRAPLQRPEDAGSTIRSLRGRVPLGITARRPDPLVVPLSGAAGKSFDKGDVRVTVHDVRSDLNNRRRQVDLSVVVGRAGGDAGPAEPDPRLRALPQNIEIVDAAGRVLPWVQTSLNVESSRVTLTLTGAPRADEPKELRYYRISETMAEVPFAFNDLPLP